MERVRSKAQGSIDQANLIFQAKRHELTIHVDNIVSFMQQRFLSAQAGCRASVHGTTALRGSSARQLHRCWQHQACAVKGMHALSLQQAGARKGLVSCRPRSRAAHS